MTPKSTADAPKTNRPYAGFTPNQRVAGVARDGKGRRTRGRLDHANNAHHAAVFVEKHVAMIDEFAARHVPEVQQNARAARFDEREVRIAGIVHHPAGWNNYGVEHNGHRRFAFGGKRHLMDVKRMLLGGRVKKVPLLDAALLYDDIGMCRCAASRSK